MVVSRIFHFFRLHIAYALKRWMKNQYAKTIYCPSFLRLPIPFTTRLFHTHFTFLLFSHASLAGIKYLHEQKLPSTSTSSFSFFLQTPHRSLFPFAYTRFLLADFQLVGIQMELLDFLIHRTIIHKFHVNKVITLPLGRQGKKNKNMYTRRSKYNTEKS